MRPAIAPPLHRFPPVVGAHERPKRADGGDNDPDHGGGVEARAAATTAAVATGGGGAEEVVGVRVRDAGGEIY